MIGKGGKGDRTESVETLIGRSTRIQGEVRFSGGLHVEGHIAGDVVADGDGSSTLSVGETGVIEGNVNVANIVLRGSIAGDVHSSSKVTVASSARINGDVRYRIIELESGAEINGQLLREPAGSAASANAPTDELGAVRLAKNG